MTTREQYDALCETRGNLLAEESYVSSAAYDNPKLRTKARELSAARRQAELAVNDFEAAHPEVLTAIGAERAANVEQFLAND